jgi:hypothetical protein
MNSMELFNNHPSSSNLNGTSIGLNQGHAYFIFDLSHHRTIWILVGILVFITLAVCICTIRILRFICECECLECCCPSSCIKNDDIDKIIMELSTRSSDGMLDRDGSLRNEIYHSRGERRV